VKNMRAYHKRVDAARRVGVDRVHTLFIDAYHDLDAETAPFDKSGGGGGPLPRLVARGVKVPPVYRNGPHVLCLSRYLQRGSKCLVGEGYRHFKAFDQNNEDFDQGVFQVEDDVLKRSVGCCTTGCGVPTVVESSERGLVGRWRS
jgi:hypothetical protein